MIRIYGGNVTAGAQDGIEVGTEENPILFDGLYPAFNGNAKKTTTFAIRTDGEIVRDVFMFVTIFLVDNKEVTQILYMTLGSTTDTNYSKVYINTLSNKNILFSIKAVAYGTEASDVSPDLRGKLYIVKLADTLQILS